MNSTFKFVAFLLVVFIVCSVVFEDAVSKYAINSVTQLLPRSYLQNGTLERHVANSSTRLKIAILIPSTTRGLKNPSLMNLSLASFCIPSLVKSAEENYTYTVYVGIDKGDYLESQQQQLKQKQQKQLHQKLLKQQ